MTLLEKQEIQGNWLFRYRGYLPLIILGWGFFFFLNRQSQAGDEWIHDRSYFTLFETGCLLISLCGQLIRALTIGFTPNNTSGRNTNGQLAETLNTTGIYSLVRHPLYVGNFFMWLGIALLTGNAWFIVSFVLLYILYYERIMVAEEQFLARKFGEIFHEWAERTPAVLPRFRNYKKPVLGFSWRKVLKNEKSSFLLLFLTFFAFDLTRALVRGSLEINYILLGGFVFSIALYILLKYLQRRGALNEPSR